ncbi:MAG: AMP-binding protein, partial [Proteobacteria bacterium]|nr:AMP-binding protein [Pseudomonadota bacterium]
AFTLGLVELGIEPEDKVLIIGDNCVEWVIAEFGAIAARGVCVGAYQDMLNEEVAFMVTASGARYVGAGDQEQVDKFISIWDRISDQVRKVFVWDLRGMSDYLDRYPFLVSFDQVLALGWDRMKREPNLFEQGFLEKADPEEVAVMLPTSGTTGLPKLAMVTHGNFLFVGQAWEQIYPSLPNDEVYSFLPIPWIGEQFNIMRFVDAGFRYNFPESSDPLAVRRDMTQLQSTFLGMSARMWEDICSNIMARMEDAPPLKRKAYNLAMTLGLDKAERLLEGRPTRLSLFRELLYRLLFFTTIRGVRQRTGLARIRTAFTGGAAIGREVFTFFTALGINLIQGYGMTECCCFCTVHRGDDIRPETVGPPLPGIEVRIDEAGMIWTRGPGNMKGYFKNPEETADALVDGWLKTGDAGYWDEAGHLVVLDRQKDLMFLNDGTRFAPQDLENRLKFSPFVRDAVVMGDKRDFIVALISIDMENAGNWARNRNVAYTTFTDLAQNPRVYELVRSEVEKINQRLPETMRLIRFALLPKELHPDDEELTRTRKVKRRVINERYGSLIEALFTDERTHHLDIEIRYMDGRVSRLESDLHLEDMRKS